MEPKTSNAKPRKSSQNMCLDQGLVQEFHKYADRLGIKISPWVNAKMHEFVEEQKLLEDIKSGKKSIR